MSSLSGPVLWASAVLSAPSAVMVFQGTMTVTDGLERTLIVIMICWAAISLVGAFLFPTPSPRAPDEQPSAALHDGSSELVD